VVVDSCSVRAKRGGELTGRNPTDRGKLGTKYHVVVATDFQLPIFEAEGTAVPRRRSRT
jgi:hypothetical protein